MSTKVGEALGLGSVNASSKDTVRLAARNEPPAWPSEACGKAATAVCTQCLYAGKGFCCSAHVSSHECGEDMLLPVVNSPRMDQKVSTGARAGILVKVGP